MIYIPSGMKENVHDKGDGVAQDLPTPSSCAHRTSFSTRRVHCAEKLSKEDSTAAIVAKI